MKPKKWTPDDILNIARSYQPTCVLAAAADLDVFSIIGSNPMSVQSLCMKLGTDPRATTVLLDALAAMGLLAKKGTQYSVPYDIAELLTEACSTNILPAVRHQANCLHRWAQLTRVTQTGKPAEHLPSIRGATADQTAFIGAMHNFAGLTANQLAEELGPLNFHHLLDIGGASGTWTIAFLRAFPNAKATLFDLPEVIPLAQKRVAQAGLTERVTFVQGDFYSDTLPAGADFVWLSAITHQNSREQNRALFSKIYDAMEDNGFLIIRDVVMDESRTFPEAGAMFAVNMLVATEGGGTYTFDEFKEYLIGAGFADVNLIRRDEFMNSLIRAGKP